MKEFEKWKKNEACSIAICNSSDCNDCDILRKQAWRAALEWAHTKLTNDIMLSKQDRNRIDNIIKKELEE